MASVGNRQNLTDAEAALAIDIYDSNGRFNPSKTKAANDTIFHTNNVVTSVISGSVVKNASATLAKHQTARNAILNGLK